MCTHRDLFVVVGGLLVLETGWSGYWWEIGQGQEGADLFSSLYILLYDLISLSWTITGFINKKGEKIWTICGMSSNPVTLNLAGRIVWPKLSSVTVRRALNSTSWAVQSKRLPSTHHLPGVAHIVGFLSSLPQLVYVPRQRWVHRDCDNPAA